MIDHDGKPTIASRRVDPLLREAIAKGGHLGDSVARAILESKRRRQGQRELDELEELWLQSNLQADGLRLVDTLASDDEALD